MSSPLHDLGSHGLVLSSGGADGAFAVGVIKALAGGGAPFMAGRPVDPGVIVGTSIGAFNAACLLSHEGDFGASAGALERIWRNELAGDDLGLHNGAFRFRGNPIDYFSPLRLVRNPFEGPGLFVEDSLALAQDWSRRAPAVLRSSEGLLQRVMKLFSLSALVSTRPLGRIVSRNISFRRLRDSDKTIAINVTNATTGELKTFYNRDFTDEDGARILLASAAIPGLLPSVELGGEKYIDGAVLAYTKLAPAINAGARTLHLVHVDPDVADVAIAENEAMMDTLMRMFRVTWAGRVNRGMRDSGRINRQVAFVTEFARDHRLSPAAAEALYRGTLPPGCFECAGTDEQTVEPTRIAVHRYFPRDGDSDVMGMLDFSRSRVDALIEKGYEETLRHDCERNDCVLPVN